jgi:ketosteroid isomerase-like protein
MPEPHPNALAIQRFYASFARVDVEAMADLYADDVRFDDPVFSLQGKDAVMAMWRMLCANITARGGADWSLAADGIRADDRHGEAHWAPTYRFSATGRLVHNRIAASFVFENGRVVRHLDHFDFWRWSRQALGTPGWLLGWSGLLRRKVQGQALARLLHYRERHGC